MKMSIEWHKQALENTYNYLEKRKAELERLRADVELSEQRAMFYHVQVHEAEKQGKDGFDDERFIIKQKHHYIKTGG